MALMKILYPLTEHKINVPFCVFTYIYKIDMFIITQVLKSVKSTQFHGKIPPMFDCHSSSTGLVGTINWLNRDRVASSLSTEPIFRLRKDSGNRDLVPTGILPLGGKFNSQNLVYVKGLYSLDNKPPNVLIQRVCPVFTLAFVNQIIGPWDLSNYQISPVGFAPHSGCKHNLLIGLKQSQYGP